MAVTVEGSGTPFEVEVKRFHVGAVLVAKCPGCGAEVRKDFGDHYLSYPMANEPFDTSMVCGECEHNWKERIILRVLVEAASV